MFHRRGHLTVIQLRDAEGNILVPGIASSSGGRAPDTSSYINSLQHCVTLPPSSTFLLSWLL